LGFGSLKYEFTDWLNIQARYGVDYLSTQYEMRDATGLPYWFAEGQYSMNKETSYEANADLLLTFNKQLSEKVGLLATAGGNLMYRRKDGIYGETGPMIIPDFHTLANAGKSSARSAKTTKAINSVYATASLSYDNTLYLDMTARNDWSSTLSSKNRAYFYPSVGASWLFTESLSKWDVKPDFLDFGKLRLSWAQVGNDTDPYRLLDYLTLGTTYVYNPETDQVETVLNGNKSNVLNNPNLKNETITSWETGLELRAFNNRLGLDFTYYNKDATDQILRMNVPASTGYSFKYVNAGKLRNNGVELLLMGTPVKTKDFSWDVTLNYSKNKSKIIELADGIETQELQDASLSNLGIKIVAVAGGSYGDIYGKAYTRNDKGELIINENGLPTFESDYVKLGNYNPDWMGGIINAFRFKNVDFSFQIDGRFGGDVFMGSMRAGTGAGTLKITESGRDKMIVAGVDASGQKNVIEITAQQYWTQLATGTEPWIYDATNIRLREMSLGYSIPGKVLKRTPFRTIKFSLVGRNLWMIHSKTKGFDPEAGYSTSNAQGIEFGSMPTMSSYGFNLNVTF
jgi:outer membrane receptor protein involved in Fe transport